MSGQKIDWTDVVERNPIGHFEWQKSPVVYNGKIESIRITDADNVEIKLRWLASMPYIGQDGFGVWTKVEDERMLTQLFPNLMVAYTIEDTPDKGERVVFGPNIIYFEDRCNLDPSTIEGMEPSDYE